MKSGDALEAQVSLLRLLQNGEVTRVGGKHTRLVNVRVLAATNRNLENAIRQNAFREDLYYRLTSSLSYCRRCAAGCRTLSFWPSIFC